MTTALAQVADTVDLATIDAVFARAETALAEAQTLAAVTNVHTTAEALREICKKARSGFALQHRASRIKLTAERKGGQILAAIPRTKGGRPNNSPHDAERSLATPLQAALDAAKLSADTGSRWEAIAKLSDKDFQAFIARSWDAQIELTTAWVLRHLKTAGLLLSESNEWYTPDAYIEASRKVLGGIDLDPASSRKANKTIKARRIFTADENGLTRAWAGRVWLNPPYGGLSGPFAEKLITEYEANRVTAAILLINAHATDTDWFQALFNYLLCFTDHRIDFSPADNQRASSSTHGSVFVYFGAAHQLFVREFAQFGAIVARAQ
jgi:hypothetical protein